MQEKLRDIKPLVEIPDSSYYIYYGLIALGVLLLVVLLYLIGLYLWRLRKENLAKRYLEALKAIDWRDSKASAYAATKYGRLLATDTRRKELFSQLEALLQRYKYKKEVDPVDEETKRMFDLYVQVCDESI